VEGFGNFPLLTSGRVVYNTWGAKRNSTLERIANISVSSFLLSAKPREPANHRCQKTKHKNKLALKNHWFCCMSMSMFFTYFLHQVSEAFPLSFLFLYLWGYYFADYLELKVLTLFNNTSAVHWQQVGK
jgi:hypothetical protein